MAVEYQQLPSVVAPSLLGTFDPSKYIVKLPEVKQFQQLPDFGYQAAIKDVENAGQNIASLLNPVNVATRKTELEQQQIYQKRLTNLLNPGVDDDGNPLPDKIPYVLKMTGPGQGEIGANPMTLGQQANIFGNGPYIKNTNKAPAPQTQPQTNTTTTTTDQTQQQQTPPTAPTATISPEVYDDVTNPKLQNAQDFQTKPTASVPYLPSLNLASGYPATQGSSMNLGAGYNSQGAGLPAAPVSVNTASNLANTTPASVIQAGAQGLSAVAPAVEPTPSNVLAWYQDRRNSEGKNARVGINPATGKEAVIISHGANSNLADQPVDDDYFRWATNRDGWTPDDAKTPANPVIAGGSALTAAAAAPLAQNVSQNLAENADVPPIVQRPLVSPLLTAAMGGTASGAVDTQNPLPNALASGTITPQQILNAGGPVWASTTAQAPLPSANNPNVPQGHILMGPPKATLVGAGQGATATATPSPSPSTQTPLPPPDQKPDNFGLSAQQILVQAQNAADKGKLGTDTSIPMWNTANGGSAPGKPSQTVPIIGKDGKPGTGFVDPSGGGLINMSTVYTRQGDGYSWETRSYLDGTTKDVQLSIGPEQDKAMMNMVVEQGFATQQQWLQMTPDARESAYRLAANQKILPVIRRPTSFWLSVKTLLIVALSFRTPLMR
jgi:hypothetical protein